MISVISLELDIAGRDADRDAYAKDLDLDGTKKTADHARDQRTIRTVNHARDQRPIRTADCGRDRQATRTADHASNQL